MESECFQISPSLPTAERLPSEERSPTTDRTMASSTRTSRFLDDEDTWPSPSCTLNEERRSTGGVQLAPQVPLVMDTTANLEISYTIVEQGTKRGGKKLVSSDGYEYSLKDTNINSVKWRCTKRKKIIPVQLPSQSMAPSLYLGIMVIRIQERMGLSKTRYFGPK